MPSSAGLTTNFPNGCTNVPLNLNDGTGVGLGSYVAPDPSRVHQYFNDFDQLTAAQWVVTTVGAGSSAIGNADGGILTLTNSGAQNDSLFYQLSRTNAATVAETFLFDSTRALWFNARFKTDNATNSVLFLGLYLTDTTPNSAVSDGIYLNKPGAATTLNGVVASTQGASTTTALGAMADNTYVTAGYWWDPITGVLNWYLNGNAVGQVTSTANIPATATLAVSFGVLNNTAAARSLSVDYIMVAKDRMGTTA